MLAAAFPDSMPYALHRIFPSEICRLPPLSEFVALAKAL